jgi:hypothetical protein
MVTSPHAQSEMAAVAEFESQNWVQDLLQATSNPAKEKTFVDPKVAFPFQDDFLVGTIHSANAGTNRSTAQQVGGGKSNNEGAIEILDNKDNNDVSVLTSKTQDELVALLVQARRQLSSAPPGCLRLQHPPWNRPSCHAAPNQRRWAGAYPCQWCLLWHRGQ